jgi:hypothetical protein
MVKSSIQQWTAQRHVKMMNRNEITFDSIFQRSVCWDIKRKSLLIHSLVDGYLVPNFTATKNADETYDFLDGKQRSYTVKEFLEDGFKLSNKTPQTTLDDGTPYPLKGKRFSDLHEDIKERLNGFIFKVDYFIGISNNEIKEQFDRLNNGKALTVIEKTRIHATNLEQISETANHEIFNVILSETQVAKFENEDYTIKTWLILCENTPKFSAESIRDKISSTSMTTEQMSNINSVYNKMLLAHTIIKSKVDDEALKKLFGKINFLTLIPVVQQSISDNVSIDDLVNWILTFFDSEDGAAINADYRKASTNATTSRKSITNRHNAIMESYNKQFAVKTA